MSFEAPYERRDHQFYGIAGIAELDRTLDAVAGYGSSLPQWLRGDVPVDSPPAVKAAALVTVERQLIDASSEVEIADMLNFVGTCFRLFRELHTEQRRLIATGCGKPAVAAQIAAGNIGIALAEHQAPFDDIDGAPDLDGWQHDYIWELADVYSEFYTQPPIQ